MARPNPRATQYQLVHYLRKLVNYNDVGIGAGVYMGTLPAGAVILGTTVAVSTAFNAATTNNLSVGSQATGTEIAAAATVAAGTAGLKQNIAPNAASYQNDIAADQDVFALYTQTGAAATAGRAIIIVTYALNNDL